MKKITLVLLLLALIASFSFAQGKGLIGIAMPETHVQRWIKDGEALKTNAIKLGYTAEVNWANADQAIQNAIIGAYVTKGAKALIVGSINDGVGRAVQDAKKKKIPVLAYDRIIQNSADYDYFITFNNKNVGQLQGEAIVKALGLATYTDTSKPKNITLFAGSATDGNAFFFFDGAIEVLNPYIDKGVLKVVGPYPKSSADKSTFLQIATENWQADIAKRRMEGLLVGDAKSVTLDAILAPNDPIARAVIEACKADAKYRGKLPVVTGQDAEFASVMSIKNGEQYMTIFKDTNKLAEAAVILIDQIIRGEKNIKVPGAVVAADVGLAAIGATGKKTVTVYLLQVQSITRDNINIPADAGFYPDAEAAQIKR